MDGRLQLRPRELLLRSKLLIPVSVGVVAILGAIFFWPRPLTPEQTVKKAMQCFLDGDYRCLTSLTSHEEESQLGLEPAQCERLLSDFIAPKLRTLKRDGDIVVVSSKADESATASLMFAKGDRVLSWGLTAVRKVDRVLLDRPISATVLFTITATKGDLGHRDKRMHVLSAVENSQDELETFGVKGILATEKEYSTWSEFISDIRSRMAKRPMN